MSRIPSIEEFAGLLIVKEASRNRENEVPSQTSAVTLPNDCSDVGQRHTSKSPTSHVKIANVTGDVEVSVVTVCFNPLEAGRKEVFQKNLDSVQVQENVRLEHIIVDGASSDGTLEWLKGYNNTRYDIRILSLSDDGIFDAMNRGIALSRGKYIIFLNSDDYFHNHSGMAHSIEKIEHFGCVFSFASIRFAGFPLLRRPQQAPQRRLHRFLISFPFSHQSMLTLRDLLLKLDGFDTNYRSAADYDLLLRMIEEGAKGCFVPHSFTTFSLGGFSTEYHELSIKERILCLQSFFKEFFKTEMTSREVEQIILHHVFPRKYLGLYKQTHRLIRERFLGVPRGPFTWVSSWFNYIKYYVKCLNSSI
ncbi:MAG: glycosyltransferase [Bacteroidaceae bacterium]|nr:glycosyltransferase [Bacteroidaceae bacterium]